MAGRLSPIRKPSGRDMNVGVGVRPTGRWDAAGAIRDGGIAVGILILVLLLPPLVYGFLVWRQFDFVAPSGYIPYNAPRRARQLRRRAARSPTNGLRNSGAWGG